jgi:NAD(P)-dependent dehydrogenase (short-subunit alcohol dehydrogenase family)
MKELNGRLAFVTAGANGIGLALAKAFGAEGMNVAIGDVDEEALEKAIAELRAVTQAEPFLFNVADRAAFAQAADAAEARFGPVGVLCNNAAAELPMTPATMTYEGWDRSLSVTLGGAVNGTQTFLPRMVSRPEEAHIVNTASQAGLVAGHGGRSFTYNMSKFGVVGLSEALHTLLAGTNVGVTVICPGYTQAVKNNDMYVMGARRVDQVQERMNALIAAMPEETERDRALEEFLRQ